MECNWNKREESIGIKNRRNSRNRSHFQPWYKQIGTNDLIFHITLIYLLYDLFRISSAGYDFHILFWGPLVIGRAVLLYHTVPTKHVVCRTMCTQTYHQSRNQATQMKPVSHVTSTQTEIEQNDRECQAGFIHIFLIIFKRSFDSDFSWFELVKIDLVSRFFLRHHIKWTTASRVKLVQRAVRVACETINRTVWTGTGRIEHQKFDRKGTNQNSCA